MALKITITDAGRAALINATQSGTRAVSIVSVGISGTSITADKSASSLQDEIKRISTISGKVTALDAIHLTAKDDGSDVYTIRSFALYLDDGTLFAIYGQSSPILEKSAAAMLLLQLDIRFADIDATQIQFGNLDFINPAATNKTAGVIRVATDAEFNSDEYIAVPPSVLRKIVAMLQFQINDKISGSFGRADTDYNAIGIHITAAGDPVICYKDAKDNLVFPPLALRDRVQSALDTKFDKTGGDIQGHVGAQAFNTGAFVANNDHVDIVFCGRRTSFQTDGNMVNYGADGSVKTTLKDGTFWTSADIETLRGIYAVGMLHISSQNGKNGLEIHPDDDGVIRHFGQSDGTGYRQYLAFNPQGNLDLNSPTGAVLINGHRMFSQNFMGAGSGLDAEFWRGLSPEHFATADDRNNLQLQINDKISGSFGRADTDYNAIGIHITAAGDPVICYKDAKDNLVFPPLALRDRVQSALDTKFDKTGGDIQGHVGAQALNTGAFAANNDHVDIVFCGRRTSFQTDGNMVNYGADGSVKTTLKDGTFWTSADIETLRGIYAVGMLHISSQNGKNGLEIHPDDDGVIRHFGQSDGTGYRQYLAFNPQGNLDLNSQTGAVFINGQRMFAQNFMGAGSGLDAEFWRGLSPEHFATADDRNNLQLQINDRISGSFGRADTDYNAIGIHITAAGDPVICYKDAKDNLVFPTLALRDRVQSALDTKFDKTGGDIQGHVGAQALNTGAFAANNDHVDIVYANRRTSFQNDGNAVTYGTDGAVTTLKDGNFWTRGAIASANNVNATGMLHVQSLNGQNAVDIHSDDDGVARGYAKNANVGFQQFFAFNPQGNLDLNSPTGAVFINGHRMFSQNFMGAGSGLDAEFWQGMSPAALQRSMYDFNDDENSGWMFHPNGMIEMWVLTPFSSAAEENFRVTYPKKLSKIVHIGCSTEIESVSDGTDEWYQLFDIQPDSTAVQKQAPPKSSNYVRARCRIRILGRL